MPFVKFTETNKSFVARASISQRGMLNFTDGARHRFNMEDYSHCILYYDQEIQLIGIEMTNNSSAEGAIKIRIRKTGADVGIKSFLDYFEIVPKRTTMYDIRLGDESNWIIVDLKTGKERRSNSDLDK